jgi:hypothetical protein
MMTEVSRTCPKCQTRFKKWRVPDESSWSEEYFFVCFNDDCPYYKDGWVWMKEKYNQRASYRYAVNPTNGASIPLPVWSDSAIRELIMDDAEGDEQ